MAKATRTCPSCQTGTITFSARNRDTVERMADWRISNGYCCSDCLAKQRKQEAAEAAAEAEKKGHLELRGTEKQITWANRIRQQIMGHAENLAQAADNFEKSEKEQSSECISRLPAHWKPTPAEFDRIRLDKSRVREITAALVTVLADQQDAGWWIDHRESTFFDMAREFRLQLLDALAGAPTPGEARDDASIRPESPVSPVAAEIRLSERHVDVIYPEKDDALVSVVHSLGFRWIWQDRAYRLNVTATMGGTEDRAAEAMHKLLSARFIVSCQRQAVRQKALESSFEPIYPRWVSMRVSGRMEGYLAVEIRDGTKIENEMRMLHGREDYYRANVWYVRPEHYAELRDMIDIYSMRVTAGAEKAMRRAQDAAESAMVSPQLRPAPVAVAETKPIDRSTIPSEIDPDLRDE